MAKSSSSDPVVIVAAARTPIGSFQGTLADFTAPELGAAAIRAAIERAAIDPRDVSEVLMGTVLTAGQGQAPARQAALKAGLPDDVPATTINKMCGSGMKTIMLAADALATGKRGVIVAGGMESMSKAPYLIDKMRVGARLGHAEIRDHMFVDGLEDSFSGGQLMGHFAEETAERYQLTRALQDEFAIESLKRAKRAGKDGSFTSEIVPITAETRKGMIRVTHDEQPFTADAARIPHLKPAFRPSGSVTAANSSSISDGAAALLLMRRSEARRRQMRPLARVASHAVHAQAPAWFTTAPAGAMKKVLKAAGWRWPDVGLVEINEAFAVVPLAAMQELGLEREKVNVHGGACALGHPVGCSGARIVVTLLAAMQKYGVCRGVAAICLGGGEATAIAIERLSD